MDVDERGALSGEFLTRFSRGECGSVDDFLAGRSDVGASTREGLLAAAKRRGIDVRTRLSERVGPFRLLRILGRGGQGAVWLAEDSRFDPGHRLVAIKLFSAALVVSGAKHDGQETVLRIRREAEALSRLDDEAIAAIIDFGLDAERPWIAMRYCEGPTLSELIAARPGGTFDPREAARIVARIARALQIAHDAGVVHRDVKPSNIVIRAGGRPVLVDFGLACDVIGPRTDITRSGELPGTLAYLAPELVRSGPPEANAGRDIYALGVTLYECLVGKRPFAANSPGEMVLALLDSEPPRLQTLRRELPRDLQTIVETAMERDPRSRFASAGAFADDLERMLRGEPIMARSRSGFLRFVRRRRHLLLIAAVIGVLAVSVLLFVAQVMRDNAASRLRASLLSRSATAAKDGDSTLALLYAIEAARRGEDAASTEALHSTLDALCEVKTVRAFEQSLFSCVAIPGTRLFATASDEDAVRIFDIDTLAMVKDLTASGFTGGGHLVSSPDGRFLAAGFGSGRARIWSVDGFALELDQPVRAHGSGVFSQDGRAWLGLDETERIIRWSGRTGEAPEVVSSGERFSSATISSDGRYAAGLTASSGSLRVFDLDGDRTAMTLELDGPYSTIEFAFASHVLLLRESRAIRALDIDDPRGGQPAFAMDLGMAFSVDPLHSRFLGIRLDGSADVYDVATRTRTSTIVNRLGAPNFVQWASDGRSALTGAGGTAVVVDLETGRDLARFSGHAGGLRGGVADRTAGFAVTIDDQGWLHKWTLKSRAEVQTAETGLAYSTVAVDPRSGELLLGTRDASAVLFDPATQTITGRFQLPLDRATVHDAVFDHSGTRVIIASAESTDVWIFDRGTGVELRTIPLDVKVLHAEMHPTRDALLLACDGSQARLIDLETMLVERTYADASITPDGFYSAVYSPEASSIAASVGSSNGPYLMVFDAVTGEPRHRIALMDQHWSPEHLAFARPEGNRLFVSDRGNVVRVLDLATARFDSLPAAKYQLNSMTISDDGRHLAANTHGGELNLWRLHPSLLHSQLSPTTGSSSAIAFSTDGSELIIATITGEIRRIELDVLARAIEQKPRELTRDEWRAAEPDA